MIRLLSHVEAVGARFGRQHRWILLPRMRKTTSLALMRHQGKSQGPLTSKAYAIHLAAAATACEKDPNIVWEALPLADFDASDSPLSPYVDHVAGGVG